MGKREENKRRKRERLEAEGLRLFLEHGYDRTSIEQIAAASEVARGTFYLYYPDKLALFTTLVDRWTVLVEELLRTDVTPRLAAATTPLQAAEVYQDMGTSLSLIAMTHHEEFMLTFRESRRQGEAGEALRARELVIQDIVIGFTDDVVSRGLIDVPDSRVAILVVFGAIERLFYEFLMDAPLPPAEELAGMVTGMLLNAMNTEAS